MLNGCRLPNEPAFIRYGMKYSTKKRKTKCTKKLIIISITYFVVTHWIPHKHVGMHEESRFLQYILVFFHLSEWGKSYSKICVCMFCEWNFSCTEFDDRPSKFSRFLIVVTRFIVKQKQNFFSIKLHLRTLQFNIFDVLHVVVCKIQRLLCAFIFVKCNHDINVC